MRSWQPSAELTSSPLEQAFADVIAAAEIDQLDFVLKSVYAASVACGLTEEAAERLQGAVDKRRIEAKSQLRVGRLSKAAAPGIERPHCGADVFPFDLRLRCK